MIMNRRDVLLASCAAALWSGLSRAQRPARAPVVGILGSSSAQGWAPLTAAFLRGLAEQGYIEGQGLVAEYRWADGRYEELPAMAAALVERQPSVLVAFTTPAALAAKKATSEIPIVFTTIGNPVDIGLVPSLSRPSGNVTGVTSLNVQIAAKRLELLHELLPTDKDVALLVNPDNPTTQKQVQEMQAAAGALGWQPHILNASKAGDFEAAFARVAQLRPAGLVIGGDILFTGNSDQLAKMALQHGVPAIYQGGTFAASGGMMDYGGDFAEACRIAGVYAGRILKGEKPADLPVQQATRVRLIVNLKTAKALGITVPLSLQGRADEVIE